MSFDRCALRSAGGHTAGQCRASTMMLAYPRHRRPASREAERAPGRPITVGRSHARLLRRREIHLVLAANKGGE
jgi:hypothetical protein